MKRRFIHYAACFLLIAISGYRQVYPQWTHLGPDSVQVNSIVFDDAGRLIAGTEQGLGIYINNNWELISLPGNLDLPVTALVSVGDANKSRILLAAGNGSKSDGIFLAEDVLGGPPYYSVSLIDNCVSPQALAARPDNAAVYAGCPREVFYSNRDNASGRYGELIPIKIPNNAFGVNQPRCGDLYVFSTPISADARLYAGGFDESVDPDEALFLKASGESMTAVAKMNIPAFGAGITGSMQLVTYSLVIATVDEGIFYYTTSTSTPQKLCGSPAGGERVVDMIAYYITSPSNQNVMIAAVNSGVFLRTQVAQAWLEIGNLPEPPVCIALKNRQTVIKNGMLYAGTCNGVYCFDTSSVAQKNPVQKHASVFDAIVVGGAAGTVTFYFNGAEAGNLRIAITDLAGRNVGTPFNAVYRGGRQKISWKDTNNRPIAQGVYIAVLTKDGVTAGRRFVMAE